MMEDRSVESAPYQETDLALSPTEPMAPEIVYASKSTPELEPRAPESVDDAKPMPEFDAKPTPETVFDPKPQLPLADGAARLWEQDTGRLLKTCHSTSRFLTDAMIDPARSMVIA